MEVICTQKAWLEAEGIPIQPKVNNLYTVSEAKMIDGEPYFRLIGIPLVQNRYDCWWSAQGFIPLSSYKERELKKELDEIFRS